MKRLFGYAGKMLTVDLTDNRVIKEPLRKDLVEDWIGGEGFCTKLLWERAGKGIDPLSPENVIIISPGALVGSIVPGAGKMFIGFKSPLSGGVGASSCGGYWGPYLRFAGYDVLIIEGKAERPVYIHIEDELVEIRDASHLWGKVLSETDEILRRELGSDIHILRIGPAGERLLRDANVMTGWDAFGKGGSGAVMGSKNLKAITVRGSGYIPQYDLEGMKKVHIEMNDIVAKSMLKQLVKEQTINAIFPPLIGKCGIEVHHFQEEGDMAKVKLYYPDSILKHLEVEDYECCYGCELNCSKIFSPKGRPYKGHKCASKAEPTSAWGMNLLVDDLDGYQEILYWLGENGVDQVASSEWAGWLAECQEKGILAPEDTGGLSIKFGDVDAYLKLIDMTIKREGFGDIMAEGAERAAVKVGKGSEKCLCTIKGLGMETEVYRADKMHLLAASICERGASGPRPWPWSVTHGSTLPGGELFLMSDVTGLKSTPPHAREEKGFAKWFKPFKEAFYGPCNVFGECAFYVLLGVVTVTYLVENVYKSWTGRKLSVKDALKVGERIVCLKRAFNAREGIGRKDDYPPERFLTEPMHGGPMAGNKVENYDAMLDEYYTECGYDLKTGWPTRAKLEGLGLKDVADEIY